MLLLWDRPPQRGHALDDDQGSKRWLANGRLLRKSGFPISFQELLPSAAVYTGLKKEAAMKSLKDSINIIKERVAHLWHPHAPVVDPVAEEQTEQEERVDLFINPMEGVNVVRHTVGRRPRRA